MESRTIHKIYWENANNMSKVQSESVGLIVTSPPYPMIEMWDEMFFSQNKNIRKQFLEKNYENAFEGMHNILDKIWKECYRVLIPGGIACINIGDATRTLSKNFRLFPNHSRTIDAFIKIGFQNLPNIIWRKQTNAPNKFMGSGMLPPGAYVTLEHEYIMIFRKGKKREFKTIDQKANRNKSSYFWEERNNLFSDLWELKGTNQKLIDKEARQRSAAYPFKIAYRLINMYSVQDDCVLDPFLGTGTTSLAAIASKRNSIGFEILEELKPTIKKTILEKEMQMNTLIQGRIDKHKEFVKLRISEKGADTFKHSNEYYNFPVMTTQEKGIKIPYIETIKLKSDEFEVKYSDKYISNYRSQKDLFN